MPTTFLDSSWPQLGGKIAPESNELTDSEKSSFFWTIYTNFWQALLNQISHAAVLLLELERLYESCLYVRLPLEDAKHLSRCWAPGRAENFQQIAWRDHFFENFGIMQKPILPYSFFYNA